MLEGKITESAKSQQFQQLGTLHQQQAEAEAAQGTAQEALEREMVGKQLNQTMLEVMNHSSLETLQEVGKPMQIEK